MQITTGHHRAMPSEIKPRAPERFLRPVRILGIGTHVPDRILNNADLEAMVETSDEWIQDRTGMCERRIAAPEEATSDLAIAAARQALQNAKIAAEDIDLIVVATATPDTTFPPTACYVQHAIGATRAAGFDVTVACSSFVNALMTAEALVGGGSFRNALVIGAEKLSSITDYSDRNTCVLFGDGAGALVIGADSGHGEILDHLVGIDGSGAEMIILPAGGSRHPTSPETLENGMHFLRMEGRKVFKFAVNAICESVEQILQRNGYTIDDLDLLVPHQANLRIIEASVARLGIDPAKVAINIQRYGNTSSASIPLALEEAVEAERLREGQLACLVAFGGGLSWGATLLRW